MSDKLLSYLDSFPQVVSVWVNPEMVHTCGPAEGFVKMSRDEAIDAALSYNYDAAVGECRAPEPPADPVEESEEPNKEPVIPPADPVEPTIIISKPPKK